MSKIISYSSFNIPTYVSSCFDSLVGTHWKVNIEKPNSLDELNPKGLDTICPIEKVHVDENDKYKENYCGFV